MWLREDMAVVGGEWGVAFTWWQTGNREDRMDPEAGVFFKGPPC